MPGTAEKSSSVDNRRGLRKSQENSRIKGGFSLRNTCDYGGANGCVSQTPSAPNDSPAAVNTSQSVPVQIMNIDASRNSALYQNDLAEVRVNALFGLNLIRAF